MTTQATRWSFTVNNPHHNMQAVLNLPLRPVADQVVLVDTTIKNYFTTQLSPIDGITALTYTHEHLTSGTWHLQGYLELSTKRSLQSLKTILSPLFGKTVHLEKSRGTQKQNLTYISKENDPVILGTLKQSQGKRTDLDDVKDMINAGSDLLSIYESHFQASAKHHKFFALYADLKRAKRNTMPDVYVFYGDSGTGKTKRAYEIANDKYNGSIWSYMGGGWFDGYEGEAVALFDEFDGDDLQFDIWKKVCDRYPLRARVKCSSVNFNPKCIIFTSNKPVSQWFAKSRFGEDWKEQVTRRISEHWLYLRGRDPFLCDPFTHGQKYVKE